MTTITEADVEQAGLAWLADAGWRVAHGPDIALRHPTPNAPTTARSSSNSACAMPSPSSTPTCRPPRSMTPFRRLTRPEGATLEARNRSFHRMLVEGVTVEYRAGGAIRGAQANVIDFETPANNDFLAVNQFTVTENRNARRPDVVLFVNGLPLAIIEIKNPVDEDATIRTAWNQLQTYKAELPALFSLNEMLIVTDGTEARVGTLTAGREWFKPWRTITGETLADPHATEIQVMLQGVCDPDRFIALIRDFIVFEDDGSGALAKKMAGYHQFHAIRVAVTETLRAAGLRRIAEVRGRYESGPRPGGEPGDRRIGVVWHTQGSGKSLTMAFYAGALIRDPAMENPTIVVLTDRNDLDDQLFGTFSRCQDLLRQPPTQAESRADLRKKLSVESGGVVFTTIQKFFPEEKGDRHPTLSERRNIVVIADEAHRSQYDFVDGYARHMRDALPRASFVGFTGTPIELQDANTRAVFGDYISVYDIRRSVDDKSTVPIYFESRLAKLSLDDAEKPTIDPQFEEVTEGEEVERREKLKTKWAQLEAVVGTEKRVGQIAEDIVTHFDQRLEVLDGKAMVVCMSRRICVDLYRELVRLRPHWQHDDDHNGRIKVVMTGSASDPARVAKPAFQKQVPARDVGQAVPRPRRPLAHRTRARYVAHRLRRAQSSHHVRRQADARPRFDAGHRPGQSRVPGQARRPRRRLSRLGPRAQEGPRYLHRKRRHRSDCRRQERGRRSHAREVRGLLRTVPRLRPVPLDHRHGSTGTLGPCCQPLKSMCWPRKTARTAA